MGMRQLRAIIVVSIILGLLSLSIPIRFYGVMSGIFGSLSPPPFSFSVVRTITIVFALPALTLLLMGIALYFVVQKLERVAEMEIIRESGESLGRVKKVRIGEDHVESYLTENDRGIDRDDVLAIDDAIIVKLPENEFQEKEVYNEVGEFLGMVHSVRTSEYGDIEGIEVEKKGMISEISLRDILNVDKVIIVKA